MKKANRRAGPRTVASYSKPQEESVRTQDSTRAASLAGASTVARESWQIQSAKARFSEVFRRARTEGPQRITRQGKEGVVMLSEEQYERLAGKSHQPKNLVDFFRQSPLVGIDLDLERDRDPGRDIDL